MIGKVELVLWAIWSLSFGFVVWLAIRLYQTIPYIWRLVNLDTCRTWLLKFNSPQMVLLAVVSSGLFIGGLWGLLTIFSTVINVRKQQKFIARKTVKYPTKLTKTLKKNELRSPLVVVDTDTVIACTFGFFRPRIILSTRLIKNLSAKQLESVILHEYYHQIQRHALLLFAGKLVNVLGLGIPLGSHRLTSLRTMLEIKADNYAISLQKSTDYLSSAAESLSGVTHTKLATSVGFSQMSSRHQSASWRQLGLFRFGWTILSIGGLTWILQTTSQPQMVAASFPQGLNCPLPLHDISTQKACDSQAKNQSQLLDQNLAPDFSSID